MENGHVKKTKKTRRWTPKKTKRDIGDGHMEKDKV